MITEAEWEVMRVIWSNNGVTSKEVFEILNQKKEWKNTTVKTLLSRLVKKDVLEVKKKQNKYIYFAKFSEEDYDLYAINNIFNKICNLKKANILAKLISETKITQKDKEMLIKCLNEHEIEESIECNCTKGQCQNACLKGECK